MDPRFDPNCKPLPDKQQTKTRPGSEENLEKSKHNISVDARPNSKLLNKE